VLKSRGELVSVHSRQTFLPRCLTFSVTLLFFFLKGDLMTLSAPPSNFSVIAPIFPTSKMMVSPPTPFPTHHYIEVSRLFPSLFRREYFSPKLRPFSPFRYQVVSSRQTWNTVLKPCDLLAPNFPPLRRLPFF